MSISLLFRAIVIVPSCYRLFVYVLLGKKWRQMCIRDSHMLGRSFMIQRWYWFLSYVSQPIRINYFTWKYNIIKCWLLKFLFTCKLSHKLSLFSKIFREKYLHWCRTTFTYPSEFVISGCGDLSSFCVCQCICQKFNDRDRICTAS